MTSTLQKMRERMDAACRETLTPLNNKEPNVSAKVIRLAEQIQAWHKTIPLPDRWDPLQLGRIAARFNASRELAASALQYGGWVEKRIGTTSYWYLVEQVKNG